MPIHYTAFMKQRFARWLPLVLIVFLGWANRSNAEPVVDKSWVEQVRGVRVLHLYGTYYEMGKAHGELLRAEVRETVRLFTWIDDKPTPDDKLTPEEKAWQSEVRKWQSERRKTWIKHVPGRYREEMRGLAEGAGLSLDLVESAQADGFGATRSKSLAIFGSNTAGGKLLLTQSMGFIRFPEVIIVAYHPSDGNDHILLTCPGCLDGLAGMNSRGVVIAANPAYHENYGEERCPTGFLVREGLRRANSLTAAVTYLEKAQPADFALFLVAGRKDRDCRVVERTPKLSATFGPGDVGENRPPFQALPECVRRTYQYVDPQLNRTLFFLCGVFTRGMFDLAEKRYAEMTRYVQGISRPVSARDLIAWLRDVKDDDREDYQVVFRPENLDFWLARAKQGDEKRNSARFQASHHFYLPRLLTDRAEAHLGAANNTSLTAE